MKNFLSCKKTLVVFLVITIISLGFYACMLARPISYGMDYCNVTTYEGGTFEGTMKFKCDGTLLINNTNFDQELESRYYYKDGYVFFTLAKSEEAYKIEVDWINNNFEQAVNTPLYAYKMDAFKIVLKMDEHKLVYKCNSAIVFAVVGGVVELVLLGLFTTTLLFNIKNKKLKKENG